MKTQDKFYVNLEAIKRKGCNTQSSISLIRNNPILLNYTPIELDKKLSFIANNDDIYAALLANENCYTWSLYENGNFSKFHKPIMYGEECPDYVIAMVINFLYQRKIQKEVPNLLLEDLIENFKNEVNSNSNGYHIK